MAMTLVETVTLSATAASITFTGIGQSGKDLLLIASTRSSETNTYDTMRLTLNNNTSSLGYTLQFLSGNGSSVTASPSSSDRLSPIYSQGNSTTGGTFDNISICIGNYTSSAPKSLLIDSVTENNATEAFQQISYGIWNAAASANPVTQITFSFPGRVFQANTSISLYIIS